MPDTSMDAKEYCKSIAKDNDSVYVTCLKQNGIKHRMKEKRKVSIPNVKVNNETNDRYVIKEKIFPPNLTTFSCRDTVEGFCRENLTMNECINLCDAHENCSYGYYIRDGKKSFCYPLTENIYNLNEKNCLHFLSYDASEFGPISGNIFYKKSLKLTNDPYPRVGMYYLRYKDNYLQYDCSFANKETAIRLNFYNIDQENYSPLQYQNYLIVHSETFRVLVYDISGEEFSFLPGLIAKDNTFIGLKSIHLIPFFTTSIHNDIIQIFHVAKKVNYISVKDNRLSLSEIPTDFHLENNRDTVFSQIPISSFQTYYKDFRRPTRNKTIFILMSICILAIVLLIVYIFL